MAGQFINSLKFGILAAIALVGPKILTDSGKYFAKIESKFPTPSAATNVSATSSETPQETHQEAPQVPKRKESFLSHFFHPAEKTEKIPSSPIPSSESSVKNSPSLNYGIPYAASYPSPPLLRNEENGDSIKKTLITPLEKILRFDLTPDAIQEIWPKVYADNSQPHLLGLRAAVLTGLDNDDLTGALTYFFDKNALYRIVFNGKTGDTQKITSFLEYRFGMIRQEDESTASSQIYRTEGEKRGNKEGSKFTIRQVSGFDANHPDGVYEVHFDLYSFD